MLVGVFKEYLNTWSIQVFKKEGVQKSSLSHNMK